MKFFCLRIFPIIIDSLKFHSIIDRLHVNERFSIILDHRNNTNTQYQINEDLHNTQYPINVDCHNTQYPINEDRHNT